MKPKETQMKPKYNGFITVEQVNALIVKHGSLAAVVRELVNQGKPASYNGLHNFMRVNKPEEPPIAGGTLESPDKRRPALVGTRFVFTSAQNNTFVNENFFASLLNFVAKKNAQLIVSKFTYNKKGFQNAQTTDDNLWYDKRLTEFFVDESVKVADGLVFGGELNILPTAVNPLSGLYGYFQGNSGIIPHAKVQLESLPRMKGEDPRFLYTTGAVTLRNYIAKKAGQKAEFHHVYGALYVEVDENGDWFARQLVADENGEFYDLDEKFTPAGVTNGHRLLAVQYGDIHAEKIDSDVRKASWGEGSSLAVTLKPTMQFVHDLTDFMSRNHHNIKDPYFLARMKARHTEHVEMNIVKSARVLSEISRAVPSSQVIVVESNHDLALQRWLAEADIRKDPVNAEYFHTLNAEMFRQIRLYNSRFSIFEFAIRKLDKGLDRVTFLREDDSFVIGARDLENGHLQGGIECGLHGHRGPNGSRGTANSLKTVGRKVHLGHSHSAKIIDGAYVAGVSATLDMDYNKGPSSWSHSHIATYENGKRTIITIKNGKWRAG